MRDKPHSMIWGRVLIAIGIDEHYDAATQVACEQAREALVELEEQYAIMEENLKAYQRTIIGQKEQYASELALLKSQRDAYQHRVDELEEQFEAQVAESERLRRCLAREQTLGSNGLSRERELREQYQTALDRLWEAHDQLCGCDKPADEGRCSAPEETWGAFEYLGERERVSNPARKS